MKAAVGDHAQHQEADGGGQEPSLWTQEQASAFLAAFHKYGTDDWPKVAEAVGGQHTAADCEALYFQHKGYLSLDKQFHMEIAWLAMVQDSLNAAPAKGRSDKTPSDAGIGATGSIISGGTSTPQFASRGRRTPRGRLPDAETTPNSKAAGPSTPNGQVTASGRAQRAAAAAAGAAWGSPRVGQVREREEAATSSAKRRRVQTALFRDDDEPLKPVRRSERRNEADQAVGVDALLSLASVGRDDSGPADGATVKQETLSQGGGGESRLTRSPATKGRSPGKRGAARAGRRQAAAATAARDDQPLSASAGGFWPTISGAERDALNGPDFGSFPGLDLDSDAYSLRGPRQRRRRKPFPERPPPMMSPIKSLFAAQRLGSTSGMALPMLGSSPASASLLQPGAPAKLGAEGETGEPMTAAEVALRHCLSARTRRWVAAEFFCSAIDRPYFMRSELQEFVVHAGLGPGVRLTRREWGAVRRALGRPRRLSLTFLREERAKLESYRNIVRAKYEEVGYGNETPAEMPKPLHVGQRVTARHPITRHLHDGDVLTVAPNCYRVQFDRRELGVELVKDVDVMPIDLLDCLPPALLSASGHLLLNGRRAINGVPQERGRHPGWQDGSPQRGPAAGRAQQQARAAASEAHSADLRALAEGMSALDKKEALLVQLRNMNEEAAAGMHSEPDAQPRRYTAGFQRAYAAVLMQLKSVNGMLEGQLQRLQQPAMSPAAPAPVSSPPRLPPVQLPPANPAAAAAPRPAGLPLRPAEARSWEEVWAAAQQLIAAKLQEPAAGSTDLQEGSTARVISGCVSLLMVVQASARQNAPREATLASLDKAMAMLKPQHPGNSSLLNGLQRSVQTLAQQLTAC